MEVRGFIENTTIKLQIDICHILNHGNVVSLGQPFHKASAVE
jgi:hypothetical protein